MRFRTSIAALVLAGAALSGTATTAAAAPAPSAPAATLVGPASGPGWSASLSGVKVVHNVKDGKALNAVGRTALATKGSAVTRMGPIPPDGATIVADYSRSTTCTVVRSLGPDFIIDMSTRFQRDSNGRIHVFGAAAYKRDSLYTGVEYRGRIEFKNSPYEDVLTVRNNLDRDNYSWTTNEAVGWTIRGLASVQSYYMDVDPPTSSSPQCSARIAS